MRVCMTSLLLTYFIRVFLHFNSHCCQKNIVTKFLLADFQHLSFIGVISMQTSCYVAQNVCYFNLYAGDICSLQSVSYS